MITNQLDNLAFNQQCLGASRLLKSVECVAKMIAVCALSTAVVVVVSARASQAALYDATLTAMPGLISHWDMNETSGSTAADSVTSDLIDGNNLGTYSGTGFTLGAAGPRPSEGWDGFDASNYAPEFIKTPDQKLEMFNVSGYSGMTDLTMLGWMKVTDPSYDSLSNAFGGLQKSSGATYNYAINSFANNSLGGFVSRDDGGAGSSLNLSQPPKPASVGQWRFVAMTYEGGTTSKMYVDAVEVDTDSGATLGLFASDAMVFGNDINNGARALHGQLDELAVFNRALSTTEIAKLFSAAGGTVIGPPGSNSSAPFAQTAANLGGLRNHWSFAETAGNFAADSVGGNTGTFTNVSGAPHVLNTAGPNANISHDGHALLGFSSDNSSARFVWNSGANAMTSQNGQVLGSPSTGDAFAGGVSELTMSLWYKGNWEGEGYVAGFAENQPTRYVFSMNTYDGTGMVFWTKSDNNVQIASPRIALDDSAATTEWHHLVQTWDGDEKRLRAYVDGEEVFNDTNPAMTANIEVPDGFYVGRDVPGNSRNLGGYVDEIMLFDRALSAADVAELYDSAFFRDPADFNNDGTVDGADLTDPVDGWKARYGATTDGLDGADFLTWQRHLTESSGAIGVTAVPEPGNLTLLWFMTPYLVLCQRNMQA